MKLRAALFGSLILGSTSLAAQEWSHNTFIANGPDFWSGLPDEQGGTPYLTCGIGTQQSPIALVSDSAAAQGLPALVFQYKDTPFAVENNAHVIEVPYTDGSRLRIGSDTYRLLQFHFHAPSEHTLDGKSFAMEAHLVHINASGQLAVVGVLLTEADVGNSLIDEVLAYAPEEEGEVELEQASLSALDLLPAGSRAGVNYFAYSGSLTTPPCSEGVRWMVLADPVPVSHLAVERLHEIVSQFPQYDHFADNNRPLQPLFARSVVRWTGRRS